MKENRPLDFKELGEVVKFVGGAQPPRSEFINTPKEGYIRLIQIRDYKSDSYPTYIPISAARKICKADDIMIGRYGPPIFQILRGLEGAYNVALIKAVPNEDLVDREYIYQFLQNKDLFNLIDRLSRRTSGQTGIDIKALNSYEIPIPTLEEQKSIAKILTTWDEAINIQNMLISEKKKFLSSCALSLVNNYKSLVNFESSWEIVSLSDVFSERKEYAFESEELELYSLTIVDGVTAKTDRYNREFLVKSDKKKYKVTKYHDLVFNPQNLRYGAIALNINKKTVLLSPIYTTLEIKDNNRFDIEYFNFLLTSNEMIKYYDSIAEGTLIERMTVKPEVFLKQEFSVPPIEEQRKISQLLMGLREEITLLENELELKRLQKQGLMQQLLTGKIRVNVN